MNFRSIQFMMYVNLTNTMLVKEAKDRRIYMYNFIYRIGKTNYHV